MKRFFISVCIVSLITMVLFSSCSKEEFKPYDHPFFHIQVNNLDTVYVKANRKDTVDYKVYLSSQLQFEPIDVQFELIPGSGLEAGRDYELINANKTLHFVQGMFERPVRIAWKDSPLDPTKDNSLKIRLVSNTKNFTLGLPGPDRKQSQLVIIKN